MKAFPLLFVGLAALSTGCSSWNNPQTPGLAGPQPFLEADPNRPSAGSGTAAASNPDALAPSAAETGTVSSPSLTLDLDDGSTAAVIDHQTAARTDVWHAEYESQERRPIQTLRLGAGDRRVFITGSLRGDDAGSVWLLDAIAARLSASETPTVRYLCVRTPNPDGLAAGQPWNANGVDLNRNFPSFRHLRRSDDRSGSYPASEPETRVMLRMLGDFQPDRVVQVRTARVPALRVFVDVAGEAGLGTTLDELNLERGRFPEAAVGGSLEEFASQRLQAETITVVVPEATARTSTTVDTLLTLCTDTPSLGTGADQSPENAIQSPLAEADPRPDADAPASLTGSLEPIEEKGAHGFVELLPPPPETESGVDRPGFYELPPAR